MDFQIIAATGKLLAFGATDNPYQLRNHLSHFLENETTLPTQDDHTIKTNSGLTIKCSSSIPALFQSLPQIVNNQPLTPPNKKNSPNITLKEICQQMNINPSFARRILRKKFGAKNVRYEWTKDFAQAHIVPILTRRPK